MAKRTLATDAVHASMQINRVAAQFGVHTQDPLGVCKVFIRAYIAYHGRTAYEHKAGRERIKQDLIEFRETGELPFYVLRM